MQYELKFSEEELGLILNALSQLPYNAVGSLIDRIIAEAEGQREAEKPIDKANK
jgi:hypothetical protein